MGKLLYILFTLSLVVSHSAAWKLPSDFSAKRRCEAISLDFPRGENVEDYVRFKETLPELTEATVCGWMDFNEDGRIAGAAFSYATAECANTLALDQNYIIFNCVGFSYTHLASAGRHHLCVALGKEKDASIISMEAYVDGEIMLIDAVSTTQPFPISSNGIIVVGNDQDPPFASIADNFALKASYQGKIGNLAIWDRRLDASEVLKVYNKNTCPSDALLTASLAGVDVAGDAAVVQYDDQPF